MLLGLSWEWWLLIAVVLVGAFFLLRSVLADFNFFGQGLFGLVSVLAIIVAAVLYFTERRDKPKLSFSVQAEAVPVMAAGKPHSEVLLKLVVLIENKGNRQIIVQCVAADFSALRVRTPLVRDVGSKSDLVFERLLENIDYDIGEGTEGIRNCLERTIRKWGRQARPTFMWRNVALEPGEVDDVYFEKPISCAFSLVRVLVKVRLNPSDKYGYEIKTLVPTADLCSGRPRPIEDAPSSITVKGG